MEQKFEPTTEDEKMSAEHAKKFLKNVGADETLRERTAGKTADEVVAAAGKLGFDVTPEELTAAARELLAEIKDGAEELASDELDAVAGGKPYQWEGVSDFFAWIACGFNHHYEYTGKTEWRLDLLFHYTYYQQRCRDCGHISWTKEPPVSGPKINGGYQ